MVASEEATETVWQVAIQQSKYWNCMKPKAVEPRHGMLPSPKIGDESQA